MSKLPRLSVCPYVSALTQVSTNSEQVFWIQVFALTKAFTLDSKTQLN